MTRHALNFYGIFSLLFILPYYFLKGNFFLSLFVCLGQGVQLLLFSHLTGPARPCSLKG